MWTPFSGVLPGPLYKRGRESFYAARLIGMTLSSAASSNGSRLPYTTLPFSSVMFAWARNGKGAG